MAAQVTKDTSPAEIDVIANEYADILRQRNLPADITKLTADLRARAASLQPTPMTVPDWEAMWAQKGGGGTTAGAAPKPPTPEVKTRKRSREEGIEAVKKAVRIDGSYFWMSEENLAKGRTWVDLRRTGVVMNMLVIGPTGCGKTEGLKRLADEMKIPFYKVDVASITTADKWVGHKEIIATEQGPVTQYIKSEHLEWLSAENCDPGMVVYDEINRVRPDLLNTLVPVLDGSHRIWVPELGIYSEVHPDTMIAATANLGAQYSGTYGLDAALFDRFGTIMEQTFPPVAEEITILMKRTGIDESSAKALVAIATNTRQRVTLGELSKPISTRALIDCAYWVSAGMSVMEAAEATFVLKYSEDGGGDSERSYIRLALQGKAGK